MYRPLYWFGNNNSPAVDYNYSIGNTPVFSNGDKTVTVTLKNWKFSNGETVTSRDVEFWMNMEFAMAPKGDWCDYTPGYFPDNVASMSYPNAQHRGVPPEGGGQPDLVPLQRAVPGHPDADRMGPHVVLRARPRPPAPPTCLTRLPPAWPRSTTT